MALGQDELGKRIAQAREDACLSQPELAEKIGLKHPQSVSNYERGLTEVPTKRLRLIATATSKPLSFFLGQEEEGGLQADLGWQAEMLTRIRALEDKEVEQQDILRELLQLARDGREPPQIADDSDR